MDDLKVLLAELEAHDRVGSALEKAPNRVFLSGWNGSHPFVTEMLGDIIERLRDRSYLLTRYSHLDEDPELTSELSDLHRTYGETHVEPERFAPGAGSSSFLASLLHYIRRLGFRELCFLPPVYYNAIYWIRELRFTATRVAESAPIDGVSQLRLPPRRTCLWLTDPLWFAGVALSDEIIAEIGAWQDRTGSVVVVDGTFAYMEWAGPRPAGASYLDPDLTFRLICPTKALALHGFRFAYAIVPPSHSASFVEFHGRMHGATSLVDRAFAHRAVELLGESFPSLKLWPYVQARVETVKLCGSVRDMIPSSSGYFLFARAAAPAATLGLGSGCFSVKGYPQHVRMNVLDDAVFDYLTNGRCTVDS